MRTIVLGASLLFALNYVSPVDAQPAALEQQRSYEHDEGPEGNGDLPYDPEESEAEPAPDVAGLEEIMEAPHPPGTPAPTSGTPKKGGCSVAPGVASAHALFGAAAFIAALLLRRRARGATRKL